jgi:hypothetical protein
MAAVLAAIVSFIPLHRRRVVPQLHRKYDIKLEKPESYEPFTVDGQPVHPRLWAFRHIVCFCPLTITGLRREFVVPISGFVPSDPLLERILSSTSSKLATPSVHVIGDNDVIVVPERSQILINMCEEEKARVERHEGGS